MECDTTVKGHIMMRSHDRTKLLGMMKGIVMMKFCMTPNFVWVLEGM